MALAGEVGNEADERQLALARVAEIELDHARIRARFVDCTTNSSTLGSWMMAVSAASSSCRRENHSHGAPTRRNNAR